jgi:ABC-type uncharacterized transport system substrate-binding protein
MAKIYSRPRQCYRLFTVAEKSRLTRDFMTLVQKIRYLIGALVASSYLGLPGEAAAHPHSWIDITTTVILSNSGTVSAIRQHWLFDEYYTSSIIREKGSNATALQSFAKDALVNLAPYAFFTHLSSANGSVRLSPPVNPSASMKGKRLSFEFELPLQTAFNMSGSLLRLSIYDPTYYIEMLYGDPKAISFFGPDADRCKVSILPAKPSEEVKRRALDMDRQATPDHSLGEKFAERVELRCS